jgi:hypothetical protein
MIGKERKPSGKSQKGPGPVDMSVPAGLRGRKRGAAGCRDTFRKTRRRDTA